MLLANTGLHRYVVRQDDIIELRLIPDPNNLPVDDRGKPYLGVELGEMLDPNDRSTQPRRHALVVAMRRRLIALLVDSIDSLPEDLVPVPLPSLLQARLANPWVVGAVVLDDSVVVELDLRAIARSVLSPRSTQS